MEKRFCSECGKEMGENEKFCRACGAPAESTDKNEETVGQKVDKSIEDVKNKIATKNTGSKLNIKIIAPIVAIIVIIFLAWAVTSAFSGHNIELDGQAFHIATKYSNSEDVAQKFANELSNFQPNNVVCYFDKGNNDGDFFVIVTKNVGNITLDKMGITGKPATINGKEGVIWNYQTSNPKWGLNKNNDFYLTGLEKLEAFSYINDGVFVTIILSDGTNQDALKDIIR